MATTLSRAQIDRLGDRLRKGSAGDDDLRLLDDYRLSFREACETVVRTIRERLQLGPSARPAKSRSSIIEKLGRETIRLSQIQDIAGCRIVLASVTEQERVVLSLRALFPESAIVDRRANPSHGYRAVHIIARISEKLIEIQVRTPLQDLWAEFSEKLSDTIDPSIKYGGGQEQIRQLLTQLSGFVAAIEEIHITLTATPDVGKATQAAYIEKAVVEEASVAFAKLYLDDAISRDTYLRGRTAYQKWAEAQKTVAKSIVAWQRIGDTESRQAALVAIGEAHKKGIVQLLEMAVEVVSWLENQKGQKG